MTDMTRDELKEAMMRLTMLGAGDKITPAGAVVTRERWGQSETQMNGYLSGRYKIPTALGHAIRLEARMIEPLAAPTAVPPPSDRAVAVIDAVWKLGPGEDPLADGNLAAVPAMTVVRRFEPKAPTSPAVPPPEEQSK